MNKVELIDKIAEETALNKKDVKKTLDAFINLTTKALEKGDRVALVGFGSFFVSKKSAISVRGKKKTGEAIRIEAKKVVKFKAGSDLADNIKKGKGTSDTGPKKK